MLTPKKKLTKKELKHDPLLDSLEKGKEFYEENSKQIVAGIVALVVILLLGWGWMNNAETTRNEAMLASTKATLAAAAGIDENVLSELEAVISEYGNSEIIAQSTYQLGIAKLEAGDAAGARDQFNQLSNSSDKQLRIAGKLKLAYINEKELNHAEAAVLYQSVAMLDAGMISDYAKLQAGYAYLAAGDLAQAGNISSELMAEDHTGKFLEQVKYFEGKVLEK